MGGDEGEGQVSHEGVDLGVENLLVQQVKVGEPLASLHNVLKAAVSELGRQIVLKHAYRKDMQSCTGICLPAWSPEATLNKKKYYMPNY